MLFFCICMLGEFRGIYKKITLVKLSNWAKVYSSYVLAKWTKKPIQWGIPFSLAVEPTTSCNLRCPECPSGLRSFTRPTGSLNLEQFEKLIEAVHKKLIYLNLYFQGEPYLNPNFLEFVRLAHHKGIFTSTSTNAHYLDDERAKATVLSGLDRLIISIDGTTQQSYEQYRVGGNLEKVFGGTRRLLLWKKKLKSATPFVIFQFLVVKPNEHEITAIELLGKELGVDKVVFKTAQLHGYENGHALMPDQIKYSRYRLNKEGKYEPKNKLANHCWRLWSNPVVTWDGKVVPCCFDKDAEHQMGTIGDGSSLESVWQNEKYKDFRRQILQSRKSHSICTNCSEGAKVWA